MDEALALQMRREVLASLRMAGGQMQRRTLYIWEHELLQQMEQEGLIERVKEAEPSSHSELVNRNETIRYDYFAISAGV